MAVRILGVRLKPFFARDGWIELRWNTSWAGWALGGYSVTVWGYNAAERLNAALLPAGAYHESIAERLVNPEDGALLSRAVGWVAPCVTAPAFEEVLYRGFLLPALLRFMPLAAAVPTSALLFALNHFSLQGLLPLTCLGLFWACLYVMSNNLLVPVLVHAMWNTRVCMMSTVL